MSTDNSRAEKLTEALRASLRETERLRQLNRSVGLSVTGADRDCGDELPLPRFGR